MSDLVLALSRDEQIKERGGTSLLFISGSRPGETTGSEAERSLSCRSVAPEPIHFLSFSSGSWNYSVQNLRKTSRGSG